MTYHPVPMNQSPQHSDIFSCISKTQLRHFRAVSFLFLIVIAHRDYSDKKDKRLILGSLTAVLGWDKSYYASAYTWELDSCPWLGQILLCQWKAFFRKGQGTKRYRLAVLLLTGSLSTFGQLSLFLVKPFQRYNNI
ncbi:hypothetical protein EDC94DRAFT_585219 [Helicostylum pulchrum]|nr:hypothetical protein EDC94DRAFT_585219 [Helicostylum pulchrum]